MRVPEYLQRTARRLWFLAMEAVFGTLGIIQAAGANLRISSWMWPLLFLVPLAVAQYMAYREVRREREDYRELLTARLRIECGNILGVHFLAAHGAGAQLHPPVLLLRIWNESEQALSGCRVQAWFSPWDEQRFDPLPRDLVWWRGYARYYEGERPAVNDLAPGGSGLVVLVDDADTALQLRPFDIDANEREYLDATVVAWGGPSARAERTFHVAWDSDDAMNSISIQPLDDGTPCVDYELEPSIFFNHGEPNHGE